MELDEQDRGFLSRAIELAAGGGERVSPNPLVGAVVATGDGVLVSEGFHASYGDNHAEVVAIKAAGTTNLAGATIYVSLEPCCHQGQTPPCTQAIIDAGIARVVVASDDPSEHASGRGLGMLRDEGIEVVIAEGELAERAREINQPFRKRARTGRPYVISKVAMALDGKVAAASGDSKWISSDASRELVHRWRSQSDAVVVGIGTALADDPELTARIDGATQPLRVIFDSECRLPVGSKLVRDASRVPLTVVASRAAAATAITVLEAAGVEVIVATGENEPARVVNALDRLGSQGVATLLLEGGPKLAGAFLDAGEIDELRLFYAPLIFGGKSARDPFDGRAAETVDQAIRTAPLSCELVDSDVLVKTRVNRW